MLSATSCMVIPQADLDDVSIIRSCAVQALTILQLLLTTIFPSSSFAITKKWFLDLIYSLLRPRDNPIVLHGIYCPQNRCLQYLCVRQLETTETPKKSIRESRLFVKVESSQYFSLRDLKMIRPLPSAATFFVKNSFTISILCRPRLFPLSSSNYSRPQLSHHITIPNQQKLLHSSF